MADKKLPSMQWEKNKLDHDRFINSQYKDILEEAVKNTQGKSKKKTLQPSKPALDITINPKS